MGYLRLTIGYPKATVVHIRVTLGHLRVTVGHLRVTIGYFFYKANTTELHLKVRQTCFFITVGLVTGLQRRGLQSCSGCIMMPARSTAALQHCSLQLHAATRAGSRSASWHPPVLSRGNNAVDCIHPISIIIA